jgi:Na+/proline symporter
MFAASLVVGGTVVLEIAFDIESELASLAIGLLVAVYSLSCGIVGVLRTDKIQFAFVLLVGLAVLGVLCVLLFSQSWVAIEASTNSHVQEGDQGNFSWLPFVGLVLVLLLGDAFQPIYITRSFFAKGPQVAGKAFMAAGIFLSCWFVLLSTAGTMLASRGSYEAGTPGILLLFYETLLRDGIILWIIMGLMGAAFVALVMSTLDSVLNALGAIVVDDCILPFKPEFSEEGQAVAMKGAVAVGAIVAAILGSMFDNMIEMIIMAYEWWVPTVVPLLIYAIFWGRSGKTGGWIAVLAIVIGVSISSMSLLYADWLLPWSVWGFVGNSMCLCTWSLMSSRN